MVPFVNRPSGLCMSLGTFMLYNTPNHTALFHIKGERSLIANVCVIWPELQIYYTVIHTERKFYA